MAGGSSRPVNPFPVGRGPNGEQGAAAARQEAGSIARFCSELRIGGGIGARSQRGSSQSSSRAPLARLPVGPILPGSGAAWPLRGPRWRCWGADTARLCVCVLFCHGCGDPTLLGEFLHGQFEVLGI